MAAITPEDGREGDLGDPRLGIGGGRRNREGAGVTGGRVVEEGAAGHLRVRRRLGQRQHRRTRRGGVVGDGDGDGCRVGRVADVVGGAGDEGVLASQPADCSTSLAYGAVVSAVPMAVPAAKLQLAPAQ